jgi:hypothetical protein
MVEKFERKRDHFEGLEVKEIIILKLILNKRGGGIWYSLHICTHFIFVLTSYLYSLHICTHFM